MLRVLIFLTLNASLAAQTAFDAAGLKALEQIVEQAVAKKNPPGAVVWLEHQGQSHTVVKGDRELVPVSEAMMLDTLFDVASLTKVIATTPSILVLMDQGKLKLEAPVSLYLPEFEGEGRELIRLRHLLTHTSGLSLNTAFQRAGCNGGDVVDKALGGYFC